MSEERQLMDLLDSYQMPIAVSATTGSMRGIAERVQQIRNELVAEPTRGSCNWSGWGN